MNFSNDVETGSPRLVCSCNLPFLFCWNLFLIINKNHKWNSVLNFASIFQLNGNGMVAEMESDDDQDMSGGQRHHGRPRGQHQSPRPTGASSAPPPAKPKLEFLPNVVIHLKLATPNEDKRKIVADLRVIPHVAFVDVTSPTDVFIRVDAEAGVGAGERGVVFETIGRDVAAVGGGGGAAVLGEDSGGHGATQCQ